MITMTLASARSVRGLATVPKLAPTVTLASGHEMPVMALGTWKAPGGATGAAVEAAIKAGYRNIDTANDYNNEPEVGAAIKKCIDDGLVTRDELFVQCKLWNSNHRPEHVVQDLDATLADLGLDYVDSYVIHWPQACPAGSGKVSTRVDGADARHVSENPMFPLDDDGFFSADLESHFTDTWTAMEALVGAGKCRSIGLSNFNKAQVEEVLGMAKVPVSTLQNECHPYLQQKDLIDFCRANGVVFQAFSPLGSGETHLGVAPPPTGCLPLQDPVINGIAAKYGKDAGQVILKHAVARGIAVVSKTVSPARVASNFELFDWDLSAEDTKTMDDRNCGWRHLHWRETSHHPDYPFHDELPHAYELEKVWNLAPGQNAPNP